MNLQHKWGYAKTKEGGGGSNETLSAFMYILTLFENHI